jgi:TPR repeat protein
MNLKVILTTGAIFISGAVSAQTSDSQLTSYQLLNRGSGPLGRYDTLPLDHTFNAKDVKRERIAAARGDASAQFTLALRYDSGQGVRQDYAEAVKWLRKAAEQDFVKAQYNLGDMYHNGQGVPQDHAEAAKWYRKAAEQGFASAQKNLGALYGLGQGIQKSDAEAFIWSSIAAMSGDEGAVNNRDFAASKLSPEGLEAAQKRATKIYTKIQQTTEQG